MSSDVSQKKPKSDDSWFGHPRQLARLFTTEMWERFGFYGMRALLTLYLVKHFAYGDEVANGLYGAFTSLVYLTPLFGGLLADQFLGYKRSVKLGAVLMSVGYFMLCLGGENAKPYLDYNGAHHEVTVEHRTVEGKKTEVDFVTLDGVKYEVAGNEGDALKLEAADGTGTKLLAKETYRFDGKRNRFWVQIMFLALSCVIVGNGFFKPNISTIVGSLYPQGDLRRDGGFTIFYMGINLGSTVSQFLCPLFYVWIDFWAGFALAAFGMLCAWALFQFDGGRLDGYGEPPSKGSTSFIWIFIGALASIGLMYLLLLNTEAHAAAAATAAKEGSGVIGYLLALPLLGKVLFTVFLTSVVGIPIWSFMVGTAKKLKKWLSRRSWSSFQLCSGRCSNRPVPP